MNEEPCSDSEEEILVYAEFEESVNVDQFRSIHVLGLDGANPIIQMDETFFTGKYANALGTYMFFEEDLSPSTEDPLFDQLPAKNLKYVCKSTKLIKMDHAYVLPKEGKEGKTKTEKEPVVDDVQPVHFTSVQEALDTLLPELNLKTEDTGESSKVNEPMDIDKS